MIYCVVSILLLLQGSARDEGVDRRRHRVRQHTLRARAGGGPRGPSAGWLEIVVTLQNFGATFSFCRRFRMRHEKSVQFTGLAQITGICTLAQQFD